MAEAGTVAPEKPRAAKPAERPKDPPPEWGVTKIGSREDGLVVILTGPAAIDSGEKLVTSTAAEQAMSELAEQRASSAHAARQLKAQLSRDHQQTVKRLEREIEDQRAAATQAADRLRAQVSEEHQQAIQRLEAELTDERAGGQAAAKRHRAELITLREQLTTEHKRTLDQIEGDRSTERAAAAANLDAAREKLGGELQAAEQTLTAERTLNTRTVRKLDGQLAKERDRAHQTEQERDTARGEVATAREARKRAEEREATAIGATQTATRNREQVEMELTREQEAHADTEAHRSRLEGLYHDEQQRKWLDDPDVADRVRTAIRDEWHRRSALGETPVFSELAAAVIASIRG